MTQTVPQEVPPSARLMSLLFGFMTSQAISVAARLGVADLLKDGPKRVEEIARATEVQAGPLYRMMRSLKRRRLRGDGRRAVSTDAARRTAARRRPGQLARLRNLHDGGLAPARVG